MSRYSNWARAIALPALLVWPAMAACGGHDDADSNGPSGGGTTSSAAGADQGGSPAEAGADQGGSPSAAGSGDGGVPAGGPGGSPSVAAGAGGSSGDEGAAGAGGAAGGAALGGTRVFVTSMVYVGGEIGGVTGGDDICQTLADAEELGGTWLAWLSDNSTSPSVRFVQSAVPYVLVGGGKIADDWDDLVDGSLDAIIDRDESGTQLDDQGVLSVWTGTDADGTQLGGNCGEWLVSGTGGVWGTWYLPQGDWSFASGQNCTTESHLYCFEN